MASRKPTVDHINPDHYQFGRIQTKDFIRLVTRELDGDEGWCVSNIIKYVSRYRRKHPQDPTRDLKKIAWYLEELIQIIEEKEGKS